MSDAEIRIYQGDAIKLEFHIIDDEGDDFDLTNFTERKFIVKESKDDLDALLEKTELDIVVTSAVAGRMELQLKNDDTKVITVGRNWYELQVVDPLNDLQYTVLQGYFTVIQKVAEVV